jgi:hypothetical protein
MSKDTKKWVKENPSEFGKEPSAEPKKREHKRRLYRESILERCKRYDDAPTAYLETMLKTLPEITKWYFNVFQTIFIAGIASFETAVAILFFNNLLAWLQRLPSDLYASLENIKPADIGSFLSWFLPALVFFIIFGLATWEDESLEVSRLSQFIQTRFYIVQNIKEIEIEMYYISKTLEERKKTNQQLK